MIDITREEWTSLVSDVKVMKTTLVGMEGEEEGGLCGSVKRMCEKVDNQGKHITRLWIIIAALVGGSGGTLGIYELAKRLAG